MKWKNVTLLLLCLLAFSLTLHAQFPQIGEDIDGVAAGDGAGDAVSVSADGTTVAVGAAFNAGDGTTSGGHVRVFRNVSGTWTQLGSDINGEEDGDQAGFSVSLSADGNTLAVGIPETTIGANTGKVRIYRYASDAWTQVGMDIDGEAAGDLLGWSVSLSADGNTVAAGATGHDVGSNQDVGHVRVFRYESSAWTQLGSAINGEAVNDESGNSVSLSADGNTLAIGAHLNDGNGANAGYVRVFRYESSAWTQLGSAINGEAAGDESGYSVSLSADGNTLAIGAHLNDPTNAGHVRVFRNVSDTWTQVGMDIDGEALNDQSGNSVSLSADGNTLAIGAQLADGDGTKVDAGHVQIYRNVSDTWTQVGMDIDGEAAADQSGYAVSLSADATTVAIGAIDNDNANGVGAGHVRVYNIADTVSVSAVASTVTEGADAMFTLTRDTDVGDLTVNVRVDEVGSYVSGDAPTTVTFAHGRTDTTITVPITDDEIDEVDGSIKLTVLDGVPYKLNEDSTATVAVMDDDLPAITIAGGASVTEGADATFTLTRTGITAGQLAVDVTITQDGDFTTETSATVTFATTDPATATATLAVGTQNDDTDEENGSITVTLDAGTGYAVGDPDEATVAVEDDDLPAITITADATSVEESAEEATFTLSRTTSSDALTVDVDVTQTGGYIGGTAPTTVDFTDGMLTATLTVAIDDDETDEANGSITATIETGAGYTVGTPGTAMVTVVDDDLPIITIEADGTAGPAVAEGTAATYTLTRAGLTTAELDVNIRVDDEGGYLAGNAPTMVTFAVNKDTYTLSMDTEDDEMDEADGSIKVTIIDGTLYTLSGDADSTATVTVTDDDLPVITIARAGDASVAEGTAATYTLTRAGVTTAELDVNVRVDEVGKYIDGNAPTMVTFLAGSPTYALSIDTEDDTMDEVDGSIKVAVITGTGYELGDDSTATVTVTDDDLPAITIAADMVSVTEGTAATYTLTRTTSEDALTVNVGVTELGDYIAGTAPKTVDFADGAATATLTVATVDDGEDELNNTITATVLAGTGYVVGSPASAMAGINDNDGDDDPTVTITTTTNQITEGENIVFTVTRTNITRLLPVNVAVTQDGEYIDSMVPTMVTIADGERTVELTVSTDDDAIDEENGSITATIIVGTGYLIGDPSDTTVMVADNDLPTITIAASSPITEGTAAEFTLTRTTMTGELAVNVEVTQVGDYATTDGDIGSKTLTFADGMLTATHTIATEDDTMDEEDGSITVTIAAGTTYRIGDPSDTTVMVADNDLPIITIEADVVSVVEGTAATYTITRTGLMTELIVNARVDVVGDYLTGSTPTLTFRESESTYALTINTEDDEMDEEDGSITVTIIDAIDGSMSYEVGDDSTATVAVTDDDLQAITIAADMTSVTEGEDATFTLERTTAEGALTVNVMVTEGGDYIDGTAPTTVDFADGVATATLTVATNNDGEDEQNNVITATVMSGTEYVVGNPATATVGVEDNDAEPDPVVTIATAASQITEGTNIVFTLTRDNTGGSLQVNVAVTQEGEYIDGMAPATVDFANGEATATLTVITDDDAADEANGSITATIAVGVGYSIGDPSTAMVTVADDDLPAVTVAADMTSVTEGTDATFMLTRTTTSGELTVNVEVVQEGDYATNANDIGSRMVTFADGSATATLTIATEDDAVNEDDGKLTVTIGSGTDYEVGDPASAEAIITDDDDNAVSIAPVGDVTEGEDAVFTLTRTMMAGALTVNVEVTQQGEYTSGTGQQTVDFVDGMATATLTIATDDDNMDEADGAITATIVSGMGYEIGDPSTAMVAVADNDDLLITVTIAAASTPVAEGTAAEFTLTRTETAGALTVNVEVTQEGEYVDGTAPTTVDFADGEATATLAIATDDDETDEEDGSITATVGMGTGYEVGDPASAEVAVTDNDERMLVGLQAEERVTLYPNPVGDRLQVTLPKAGRYILEVYTLSGRRERTYHIEPKEKASSMDVSRLSSGMYVVILTDASGQSTQYRVVKE